MPGTLPVEQLTAICIAQHGSVIFHCLHANLSFIILWYLHGRYIISPLSAWFCYIFHCLHANFIIWYLHGRYIISPLFLKTRSGKDYPFSRAPWPQVTAMYPRIICQVRMRSLCIINFMRSEFPPSCSATTSSRLQPLVASPVIATHHMTCTD